MPNCARDTDVNSHGGGAIIAVVSDVFVNGLKISTIIDPAKPDAKCPIPPVHCNPATIGHSPNVFANSRAVHRLGDSRVCGAVTVSGSGNVIING